VTARVGGRIDRVYADFTGMKVNKGHHLVLLYSPELLSAQEELIQSIRMEDGVTTDAAREKLRLLGVTEEQIADVERTRKASDHLTLYSPISGVIVGKEAVEGVYVKTGSTMYTIADLSRLWVQLDAYESDIGLVRFGQEVELTTASHPGRTFRGTVAFVDPVLNEETQTVKVRVNVSNEGGRLKPGMFVRATLRSPLDAHGVPVGPDLAGKWVCPMHPEIVKAGEGACEACGMPLVRAEESGYGAPGRGAGPPLVIPSSAPLITGRRAVVYVGTEQEGEYEGREVVLGPRAGDFYIVREGLSEGDTVVVNGNFRIDSALQIMGRPSMMAPAAKKGRPQTKCPIMGGAVNASVYADHGGHRVYFCCPGCDGEFRKDPDGHIRAMLADGIDLGRTPEN